MTPPGNSPAPSRGHALKQLVDHLIASLPSAQQGTGDDQLGLVYLGTVHDSIPRLLILDHGLRLEERCVWQIMRICITDPARPASLLMQNQLAAQCGVDVKTLRRYLYALRANRWISQCAKIHQRGIIWALHDEPLSFADTALLDPGYLTFLHDCSRSSIRRIRDVGSAVLRSLSMETTQGYDYSQPISQLELMAERLSALDISTARSRSTANEYNQTLPQPNRGIFATNPLVVTDRETFPINSGKGKIIHRRENCPVDNEGVIHRGANFPVSVEMFSVEEEKSSQAENSSNAPTRGSSNYLSKNKINKNTTTTKQANQDSAREVTNREAGQTSLQANQPPIHHHNPRPRFPPMDTYPDWVELLQWPKQIKAAERKMMLPALCAHDQANAQYLLNYLIDRLRAANLAEAAPVPNPVGYLCQIAALHAKGQLVESSWGTRQLQLNQSFAEEKVESKPMGTATATDKMNQLKQQMGWRR